MRWLKRDMLKAGIVIVGLLLFLPFMVLIPMSASAYGGVSRLATAGPVQATPTVDLTVTALAREQLRLQVQQLQNQLQDQNNWFERNSTALIAATATVIVAIFGILQWAITIRQTQGKELRDREDERKKEIAAQDKELADRKAERDRRAEERFQKIVEGLGSDKEQARTAAAIMLHSFLQPGYEQFYKLAFELAVANLRSIQPINSWESLESLSQQFARKDELHYRNLYRGFYLTKLDLTQIDRPHPFPQQHIEQPSSLNQALAAVFKDSFRLVRNKLREEKEPPFRSEMLDARGIRLDGAYLYHADLDQVWLPQASLIEAYLYAANMQGAQLGSAYLSNTDLRGADLQEADLTGARLLRAKLGVAHDGNGNNHRITNLTGAIFRKAILIGVDLTEANLHEADLCEADLCIRFLVADNQARTSRYIQPDFENQKISVNEYDWDTNEHKLVREIEFSQTALIKEELAKAEQGEVILVEVTTLARADLSEAKLDGALLIKVDLRGANLRDANIQQALILVGADLRGVKGLSKEQLELCKAKGAIIDEDTTTDSPEQDAVPALLQNNDIQTPPATPAQAATPPANTDASSSTAAQPSGEP